MLRILQDWYVFEMRNSNIFQFIIYAHRARSLLQKTQKEASMKTVFDLQNSVKEKTARIEAMEIELKESEALRATIINLMSNKRKK